MSKEELRAFAKERGVKQWEAAEEMGIHEVRLSQMFRHDLREEEQTKYLAAVMRVADRKRMDKSTRAEGDRK